MGGRVDDGERDGNRVEEPHQVALVQDGALVLLGDVAEDDHGAASGPRDAGVEHEVAAVERGRPDADASVVADFGDPSRSRAGARPQLAPACRRAYGG